MRTDYPNIRTDSIIKTELPNHMSRDEVTAPADIGPLEVGTVLVRAANGTVAALAGGAGTAANCVLLEAIPADNVEMRVVVFARTGEIALQDLRWPAGYVAGDQGAAVAALRDNFQIVARKGV
jgi:hypothetical protein